MGCTRPICPKCGEPAQQIKGTASVVCVLLNDGELGRVLYASRPVKDPMYVCGGGHEWKV